jgi:FAD/FMN-containing dehydrogenase
MKRSLAVALLAVLPVGAWNREGPQRCEPWQPCWPGPEAWKRLSQAVNGHLEVPRAAVPSTNPYALQDQSGGTQSAGWLDAWTAAPSAWAVAAESAADVAAAVDFAREHNLRLVIKGTGHDYLGRSNAPDSLLVWTHKMRGIAVVDAFVPHGCPTTTKPVPAVTVEAGVRWGEAYEAVTVQHGRYVQGGGCTSVGAAGGFLQGGGFGSWSKMYGVAAAGLLEAEVVTADGKVRVVNSCQNPDLFWALRGGGGGTFGVVTKATLMTHPLPSFFGFVDGKITAKSDAAFEELIEHFLDFYRQKMSDEHWGEQVSFRKNNTLQLSLSFAGLNKSEAEQVWQPFRSWAEQHEDRFAIEMKVQQVPADKMWNQAVIQKAAPEAILADDRADAPPGHWWWKDDADQVGITWYAYQSRWVPLDRFVGQEAKRFAHAVFQASRHRTVAFHFNKGQAGAAADAIRRGRETSINPALFDAAALVIIAAGGEPSAPEAKSARDQVNAAMKLIRDATPGAGSYVNETDYFEADWQRSFWGTNYPRLLEIKRQYDPKGLFFCHHCVGSEGSPAAR